MFNRNNSYRFKYELIERELDRNPTEKHKDIAARMTRRYGQKFTENHVASVASKAGIHRYRPPTSDPVAVATGSSTADTVDLEAGMGDTTPAPWDDESDLFEFEVEWEGPPYPNNRYRTSATSTVTARTAREAFALAYQTTPDQLTAGTVLWPSAEVFDEHAARHPLVVVDTDGNEDFDELDLGVAPFVAGETPTAADTVYLRAEMNDHPDDHQEWNNACHSETGRPTFEDDILDIADSVLRAYLDKRCSCGKYSTQQTNTLDFVHCFLTDGLDEQADEDEQLRHVANRAYTLASEVVGEEQGFDGFRLVGFADEYAVTVLEHGGV